MYKECICLECGTCKISGSIGVDLLSHSLIALRTVYIRICRAVDDDIHIFTDECLHRLGVCNIQACGKLRLTHVRKYICMLRFLCPSHQLISELAKRTCNNYLHPYLISFNLG